MEIELADAVAVLRDELLEAAARGSDQELSLKVGAIELEFAVELRVDARVEGGFRAWLVSAGADAGVSRDRTHRVKLSLVPEYPGGRGVLIHGSPDRPAGPGDVSGRVAD